MRRAARFSLVAAFIICVLVCASGLFAQAGPPHIVSVTAETDTHSVTWNVNAGQEIPILYASLGHSVNFKATSSTKGKIEWKTGDLGGVAKETASDVFTTELKQDGPTAGVVEVTAIMDDDDDDDNNPDGNDAPSQVIKVVVYELTVTHIKFNHQHDAKAPAADALPLRKSFKDELTQSWNGAGEGEWQLGGGGIKTTNDPALYVAESTATIMAQMRVKPAGMVTSLVVRAQHTPIKGEGAFLDVVVTKVEFDQSGFSKGKSNRYVSMKLSDKIPKRFDRTKFDWKWLSQEANGSSSEDCSTQDTKEHTVYTILGLPPEPWTAIAKHGSSVVVIVDPKTKVASIRSNPWVSALDFLLDPAKFPGTKGKDAIAEVAKIVTQRLHSNFGLKYDTKDGEHLVDIGDWITKASDAAPRQGGEFKCKLTAFIASQYDREKGKVCCFNMSALVTTCVALIGGSIETTYLSPFGYINETSLIGVGKVNNPFFNDPRVRDKSSVTADKDAVFPARSQFSKHSFSTMDGKVFDATVGPHLGTAVLKDYYEAAVDRSTRPEQNAAVQVQPATDEEYKKKTMKTVMGVE